MLLAPLAGDAVSGAERIRIHVDWLKIVGRSLGWVNGTVAGVAVAVLFKGTQQLQALRADALAATSTQLQIEATVTQGRDALVVCAYHGPAAAYANDVIDDRGEDDLWQTVVTCAGKRTCDVRWAAKAAHSLEESTKDHRHAAFAAWLVETFGAAALCKGSGMVDIAGGAGELAAEVHARTGATVTVIDPLEDFEHADGTRWTSSEDRSAHLGAGCSLRRERFNADWVERDASGPDPLLPESSLICGMHPDQATEAIVDVALLLERPFAVVPCCTFNALFPHRRRHNGDGVRVYASFLDYLQEKDSRIQRAVLPVRGRNVVLYGHGQERSRHGSRHVGDDSGDVMCEACSSGVVTT